MLIATNFVFIAVLICVTCEESQDDVDPEYLSMLRATGNHAEYARLVGIDDVNMIIPSAGSEDAKYTRASSLGDIMFTAEEARQGKNFRRFPDSKWQNRVVPYEIKADDFTPAEKTFIESSIDQFNKRVSNVEIRKRAGEQDYVLIINGKGCWSYLGRIGGRQLMSLSAEYCLYKGIIYHEFMHALGFAHEHNRSDRDRYVGVRSENIPAEWQSEYQKVNSYDYVNQQRYDYYSVLHYGMAAPVTRKAAFDIKQPNVYQEYIGQREDMTNLDVMKINSLYA